jgi:hypothetical protein
MSNTLFSNLIPDLGRIHTKYTAKEMIDRVGQEIINNVVCSILLGGNVRSLTEGLTRRRILLSNASLFLTYLKSMKLFDDLESNISSIIQKELLSGKLSSDEKIFLQWFLGLTGKSIQNVLRSNPEEVKTFLTKFDLSLKTISNELNNEFGEIQTHINIDNENYLLEWPNLLRIFYSIGTQTLALRGSEKSMYGKLFEKLTLGSLLTILGFEFVNPKVSMKTSKVFWLSERKDKRESDATLLFQKGKGVRFDFGFIGPGNPEISLDKVSRFEKEMEFGRQLHYMTTIIIIDRIAEGSRIVEMAEKINGHIIQMSMTNWVSELVVILKNEVGYSHPLTDMNSSQTINYIKKEIKNMNLSAFI